MLKPARSVSVPFTSKNLAYTAGLNNMKLIKAWISTSKNPVIPNALRASSQPDGSLTPTFLNGPKPKLQVNRINAAKEIPLFKMKNGKSFHGTVPATW